MTDKPDTNRKAVEERAKTYLLAVGEAAHGDIMALLAERDAALVVLQQYILGRQERESEAFADGAEAMREAAAAMMDYRLLPTNAAAIRALPLPERAP